MFKIVNGSQPRKFLKKCEKQVRVRLIKKIEKLAIEPFPQGVESIKGEKFKAFRIRVGDYRVKYIINHEKNEIGVYEIEKRERAY